MTASAHDVVAALRARHPGLGKKQVHKLLYYCQGYHLAAFGEPLFSEAVSAWDMGPVVGELWYAEKNGFGPDDMVELSEAQLNTIGYVLSRYGGLSGAELERLSHSEPPWQLANAQRAPGGRARIELDWMRDYFKTASTSAVEQDEPPLDSAVVAKWLRDSAVPGGPAIQKDSREAILSRLATVE